MEDGVSPYLFGVVLGCLVLLAVLFAAVIVLCGEHLKKKLEDIRNGSNPFASEDLTEEEIISMVREGHEQGVLEESEAEMIHNIFAFDDKEAKDIMIHRKNLVALPSDISFTDAVALMRESNRSRYPVYEEDLDHIVGILHIKDAFSFVQRNELFRSSIRDIDGLIREVVAIPETMKINALFRQMQATKNHLVVVVDEYGQTSGVVAMEDILEEIVGNIEDEHDEEEQPITKGRDGSYELDGLTDMDKVLPVLTLPIAEDAYDTLNGLLVSLLGKIPADDETPRIEAYGYAFEVLSVEDKIIRRVRVTRLANRGKE